MNKELQDKAWACLPKEVRDKIRKHYDSNPEGYHPYFNEGFDVALKSYFGHHNLTSDIEPEEMLIVERAKVVEWYSKLCDTIEKRGDGEGYTDGYYRGQIDTLQPLFGDKCLPDKEALRKFHEK